MSTPLLLFAVLAVAGWLLTAAHLARARRVLRTDALTGLANRTALASAFARAKRHGWAVGVLLLDLDGFKTVNDRFGHAVGNTVLGHVADALTDATTGDELAVRLHGDEFAVLLPDLSAGPGGLRTADQRAHAIQAAIARPVRVGDRVISLTTSIGAAVCPAEHAELSALLRAADQRMYATKPTRAARAVEADRPTEVDGWWW